MSRWLRGALVVGLTLVALEAAARVAFRLAPGGVGGVRDPRAARAAVLGGERGDADAARAMTRDSVPHPYLGYVALPGRDDPGWVAYHGLPVNALGFIDDGEPLARRSPDEVIVGITGGSLAYFFSVQGIDAVAEELRRVPELATKRLRWKRFALGGWKQPQQLFAIEYYLAQGGELDALINLDGFNEVAVYPVELAAAQEPAAFPRAWSSLVGNEFAPARRRALGRLVTAQDRRVAWASRFSSGPLARSVLAGSLWLVRDRALEREVAEATADLQRVAQQERVVAGPPARFADEAAMFEALAGVWARSSEMLAAVCAGEGIRYFHFLQPSQYVVGSKPLSEAERAVAISAEGYGPHAAAGYPHLEARGRELAARGVAFVDLTRVFASVEEPLYVDSCCHVSRRGNELLGHAIGAAIAERWRSQPARAR